MAKVTLGDLAVMIKHGFDEQAERSTKIEADVAELKGEIQELRG